MLVYVDAIGGRHWLSPYGRSTGVCSRGEPMSYHVEGRRLGGASPLGVLTRRHRDTRTGTGICVSRVRVTPPKMISAHRAWL
jgi:hypothetical protein